MSMDSMQRNRILLLESEKKLVLEAAKSGELKLADMDKDQVEKVLSQV